MTNRLLQAALETLVPEDQFTRRFLVNKPLQLLLPPIPLQNNFKLPMRPAIHFVAIDGITKGPDSANWYFASADKRMPMLTITELTRFDGSPTKLTVNIQNEMEAWLRQQRRFKRARSLEAEDPGNQVPIVYNYAMLGRLYRYTRSLFTELYRWTNMWTTVFDTIATADNDRLHFVFTAMPQRLPSMRFMTELQKRNAAAQIRELRDPDARFIFELWKWIDPKTRDQSIMGKLSPEQMRRCIIVFEDAGRTLSYNLYTLYKWILDPANELENQRDPIKPVDMQKRILRGMMTIMEQRADAAGAPEAEQENAAGQVIALLPQNDNQVQDQLPGVQEEEEQTFTARANRMLEQLDDVMEVHDELQSNKVVAEEEDPAAAGITIAERGDNAAIKSFAQVQALTIDDALEKALNTASDRGTLSAAEYRRFNAAIDTSARAVSPYDNTMTAREFAQVKPADTEITEVELAPNDVRYLDESMRVRMFEKLDGEYITKTLKRDIVAAVQSIQRAGIIVTSHTVDVQEDVLGSFESHKVKLIPIEGAPGQLIFKGVSIDSQGRITSAGTNYRYRRQRTDLPIRKINESQVALASYYGKTFVSRVDRAAYSYNRWLQKQVALAIAREGSVITKVHTGDVFKHTFRAPRGFTAMAQVWRDMTIGDVTMYFNIEQQLEHFGEEAVAFAGTQGFTLFGKGIGAKKGMLYAMDENNTVYSFHDGDMQVVSGFESFLGIDESSRPIEYTECRILGNTIPTGIVLGYYYGLSGLIKMLGARVRQVPAGTRANIGPGEYAIVFEDFTLVMNLDDRVASLILSGFNQASKTLRRHSVFTFDQPAVYFSLLEELKMGGRYINELDNLRDLFVDSITQRVLEKMGEPTSYPLLVHRATEMLLNEQYKRPLDPTEQRYRGAERIAGAVYNQMVQAVREHRAKSNRAAARIEMNPYNVHKHVMDDSSLMMIKDINPMHNLKEITAVTYTGHGGRSTRSMTRQMRAMDPNDQGTLGDATVDSSQVGYNAYLSMAPRFANTEGMIQPPIGPQSPSASLLSPAALASPAINSDDGKRIGMSSIQHSHTIACDSYGRNAVNTGFERLVAHQVDDSFATPAKQAGVVKSSNARGLVLEYEDGTTQAVPVGRRFGAAAGLTLPHDMATQYKQGDKFEKGSIMAYHAGFFTPALFKKGVVDWMNGTIARVAFPDSRETHEDASAISEEFSKRVGTRITTIRDVIVKFTDEVYALAKAGSEIKYNDSLCVIEDKLVALTQQYSEDRVNTLKLLSGPKNTAQVSGVVDRVEIFYHGVPEDMTDTLRAAVEESDRELAKRRRSEGRTVVTAATDEGMKISGEPLLMDTALIRVYITHEVPCGIGDKSVFGWQLKSVVSKVYHKRTTLDDGLPIDGFYGSKSLFARVVYSAFKVGTATTISGITSRQMAEIYKGLRKP